MKVTVVGSGMVGSTFAYRLLVSGMASEIVLIDANKDRALGEAEDMEHAIAVELPTVVRAGEWEDALDSDFVIVSAGLSAIKDGTRLDLCAKNAAIFKDIMPRLAAVAPKAFYIIASNPMDVMTAAAIKYSGLPHNQIIGSGTVLDSDRFRYMLAQKIGVSSTQIAAYTLGEHGDSQVPVFSRVNVRGISLENILSQKGLSFTAEEKWVMTEQVRGAAYQIISRKGATYYGIASALLRIVRAIWRDEQVILPVSCMPHGEYDLNDVCVALPALIGRGGVERIFDLSLSQEEFKGLLDSANVLRPFVQSLA